MAKAIFHADDGREFHITQGSFIYVKTRDGDERNWEWQYISSIHKDIEKIFEQLEEIFQKVENLLPQDIPMGRLK